MDVLLTVPHSMQSAAGAAAAKSLRVVRLLILDAGTYFPADGRLKGTAVLVMA